ncbi:MAG TPA: undecaprenyl-diphosphate phosphatase [Alphaproteobacteria bacterium]|nr:undecaprenyl-diphosphate phosphatase [Alphaproteobacteria bacterium]
MDVATLLGAILLGVVEGLTEFIPVSSTGHLILLVDLIGFKGPPGKVFEIVIQLGAILAVCWAYRAKLLGVAAGMFSDPDDFLFVRSLLLAFVPAMVLGVLLHGFIKNVLFSPWVVVASLIVGGIVILIIERNLPLARHHAPEKFPPTLAVFIGLCQAVAMIPGVSRSGATIMGALMLKVDRKTATEFSFFLAIPTMLAATVYDVYKNWSVLTVDSTSIIAVGFISAFICALLVVRRVIAFISRHGFVPFAWYRIALGLVMLAVLLAR